MATTIGTTTSSTSVNTQPVSVASNSSSGAAGGSVINVSSLVSQLVAASEAPKQSLIASQTAAVTTSISALGTLKSALSTFQSSLTSLATSSAFNVETAGSSDPTTVTATAGSGAVNGTYNVTVSALASAQQLLSGPFAAGSTPVGTGVLTLTLGGQSFGVTLDSTNNTVAGIAAAINSAGNNPGISAAVITGTDGAHLVLSSTLTGAANAISVAETDGGNGLAALTYGAGNTGHYTQNSPAADASFSIGGVPYTSSSNTVTSALSGVTVTLLGKTTGSGANLTVASDTTTIQKNVAAFVSAYNTLQGALAPLGSFDAATQTAGPMLGNPVLMGVQSQLRHIMDSFVGSSSYNSLASIGIAAQNDGTLTLNTATLSTALATNFSAVSKLFSGTNGVATQLDSQITQDLASTGSIGDYATTLTKQSNALTKQSDDLQAQTNALQATLTQQYSALNTLLSSLQTTSSYLTQAFAALPQVQSKSNA